MDVRTRPDRLLSEDALRESIASHERAIARLEEQIGISRAHVATLGAALALFDEDVVVASGLATGPFHAPVNVPASEALREAVDDGSRSEDVAPPDASDVGPVVVGEGASTRALRPTSQRRRILDLLVKTGEYMSPIQISDELKRRYDVDAGRTTVSSQLQKLRGMGLVDRAGEGWHAKRPSPAD